MWVGSVITKSITNKSSKAIKLLSGIQRYACLSTIGAMRSTPTAAIGVLLNVPPLHIHIQGEDRSVTYRLIQNQPPISHSHRADYPTPIKNLKAGALTGLPNFAMVPKLNFERNYSVTVPIKDV